MNRAQTVAAVIIALCAVVVTVLIVNDHIRAEQARADIQHALETQRQEQADFSRRQSESMGEAARNFSRMDYGTSAPPPTYTEPPRPYTPGQTYGAPPPQPRGFGTGGFGGATGNGYREGGSLPTSRETDVNRYPNQ